MKFRPCIDIHNGKVKQIVGGSLKDEGNAAAENFVAGQDAAWFAEYYQKKGLTGGHVILLNPPGSEFYKETKRQALSALRAFPGGLMAGGGINDRTAEEYLSAGASHVIVTSFVFREGRIEERNLRKMVNAVGKEHLVLDLSCRKKGDAYYIVTDRWQTFTEEALSPALLDALSDSCAEFLVHGVDVEGKASGIEEGLAELLGSWGKIPITYAGGVGSFSDLDRLKVLGKDRLDVTIGSALDLFGGPLALDEVCRRIAESCEAAGDCVAGASVACRF